MKTANGHEFVAMLEKIAPRKLAMESDPTGLQLGDLSKKVRKIMFTLDVLEDVVEEAIEQGVDMIIAHHPFLFRPVHKIDMETAQGRMIRKLIKHDIIVYAAHTNLDIAKGGVNDILANLLELKETEVIVPTHVEKYLKVVVFVPKESCETVRQVLMNNGAGQIGTEYESCSFEVMGTGKFKPSEKASPTIGKKGELAHVDEVRLEAIITEDLASQVVKAVKVAHPYEEPAIDLYPLEGLKHVEGLGRVGTLAKEIPLEVFVDIVKGVLSIEHLRLIGDPETKVKKVAVLGGDGNKFIHDAKRSGADVLITGDIYYHTGHDLLAIGLPTIDAGHNIEKVMKSYLKAEFEERSKDQGIEVELVVSEKNTDPFTFL
ncbi:Nif3-like dinuclear metal center hexameric protein [Listeria aquatica]|uniref:GTP cyclohydrolase 1 type 2 homolog n=1 Tax=Listeria aquatica TaxID=1494960 RepID=A0A841ZPE8_9LIST|nr:Nif3-like dinuclear metal center hexameric protein [Listeria aquatica]MBC1520840.1 Nif3-like dinuclear metal center hexameric protein [Listeria aquatica]